MSHEDKKPVPRNAQAAPTYRSTDTFPMAPPDPDRKPFSPIETPIPVKLVRFDRHVQYPGRQSDDHAQTLETKNGQRWSVDYLPAMQHFRIVYTDVHHPERDGTGYVPASRALAWEPVA